MRSKPKISIMTKHQIFCEMWASIGRHLINYNHPSPRLNTMDMIMSVKPNLIKSASTDHIDTSR